MKSNFSLKFKIFDIFVLLFAVVSIVATIITTNIVFAKSKLDECNVQIFYRNTLVKEVKMSDVNGEIKYVLKKDVYDGLNGDMVILIDEEKGVCISEVVCPNHLCVNMGWIKEQGIPVVCLPNNVYVMITSTSSVDNDINLM